MCTCGRFCEEYSRTKCCGECSLCACGRFTALYCTHNACSTCCNVQTCPKNSCPTPGCKQIALRKCWLKLCGTCCPSAAVCRQHKKKNGYKFCLCGTPIYSSSSGGSTANTRCHAFPQC